jgi:MFS family permease
MFFARMLVGIGAAPVQPYGISYMHDHASLAMAPLYLGILLSISLVGPALGYILGSGTTKLYIDFDRVKEDNVLVNAGDAGKYSCLLGSRLSPC